jgi:D-3-phosphoglycerate dehydrogenase
LHSGKVAGAALDVFSAEPYSGPLLELDNVVVTPHLAASTEEAQDRAGIIVAEQVAAALEGGLVTNAVNLPAVAAEDAEHLGPFLPLAAKLGALAVELAGGTPTRLDLAYLGELSEHDTRLLTVAALNGVFQGRADQAVNYVNAPLLAEERGIEVREERRRASRDFTSLMRVTAVSGDEEVMVAGTTLGRDDEPRLVRALGYEIEIGLEPRMLFVVNDDRPGMIGRLGTLLGEAGVNIAHMAVSRNRRSAKALMAITLDSTPDARLLEHLQKEPGFVEVRFILLEPE